jgi:hypothetical protein
MQYHSCHDIFSPPDVGYPEGYGLRHAWMFQEHMVHFLWCNALPATIDNLFKTARDKKVAISVQISLIACPEPTMRKGLTVRYWIVLVAPHNIRAANDHFPSFAGW